MKRMMAGLVTAVVASALVVGTASPASAYTYKENKVWSTVKMYAPDGASIMGKKDTIDHAKYTCKALRSGMNFDDLALIYASAAADEGLDDSVADTFFEWTAATDVAAVFHLCPGQQWKLEDY